MFQAMAVGLMLLGVIFWYVASEYPDNVSSPAKIFDDMIDAWNKIY